MEQKILDARVSGVSFCQISKDELQWHIDQIMLKGAAISGCSLPNTEFFAQIIGEELSEFILNFGFSELTYDELLLALRMNVKGGFKLPVGLEVEFINFFGNCFNIDFFSKIIANYMAVRNQLDRKLQNHIDGYEL